MHDRPTDRETHGLAADDQRGRLADRHTTTRPQTPPAPAPKPPQTEYGCKHLPPSDARGHHERASEASEPPTASIDVHAGHSPRSGGPRGLPPGRLGLRVVHFWVRRCAVLDRVLEWSAPCPSHWTPPPASHPARTSLRPTDRGGRRLGVGGSSVPGPKKPKSPPSRDG